MSVILACTKDDIELIEGPDMIINVQQPPLSDSNKTVPTSDFEKSILWIENMQSNNGLLESSENTDFVSLYDNSLAALVFIELKQLDRAERIFDFFQGKINSELLNNNGGFYQFRNSLGENGSRTWMGDNAWLLIALNKYHEITENNKYQQMAYELDEWLRSLQDSDGGLWGGYNENGTVIPKVTEGMITAFNAVKGYDDFHKNILVFLENNRWDTTNKFLVAWPENPEYNHALDLHSLGGLILKGYSPENLMQAERFLNTQISTVNGLEISGYCFDEDKDVVWLEGTAQMATAHKFLNNNSIAEELLIELEKSFINSALISNAKGIPYTTNNGTNFGSEMLWNHADLAPTLSATAWYIFAKKGFNPLGLNEEKEIPSAEKFWIAETSIN
ncbi:predicted membrane protein [Maribacter sp. HTCC2170]|nr:predicted membrane protein [Maribacter sp. HTCC2170]